MRNIIRSFIQDAIQSSLGCSLPDQGFPWESSLCEHQHHLLVGIEALFLVGLVTIIVVLAMHLPAPGCKQR